MSFSWHKFFFKTQNVEYSNKAQIQAAEEKDFCCILRLNAVQNISLQLYGLDTNQSNSNW